MYANPISSLLGLVSEFNLFPCTISNSETVRGSDAGRCFPISALLAVKAGEYLSHGGVQRIKKIDFYKALWRSLDKRGCRGTQHSYLPSCHGACYFPWHLVSTREQARVSCFPQEHWQLGGLPPERLEGSPDHN